jgi:hypothetical protein
VDAKQFLHGARFRSTATGLCCPSIVFTKLKAAEIAKHIARRIFSLAWFQS